MWSGGKATFKWALGLLTGPGIGKCMGGMGTVLCNLTLGSTGTVLRSGQLISILLLVIA